jgi:hypothetical protein
MLKLAIEANLPLVAVYTRDTMNLPDVIKALTKQTVEPWGTGVEVKSGRVYMIIPPRKTGLTNLVPTYEKMVKAESTLLVVNPERVEEPMFDAGEVPVPRSLMMQFLEVVVQNKKKAEELLRGLGGCTIKEAAELARLTMARDKSLTVQGLMATRKASFQGSKGLTQVDAAQGFYEPPADLVEWVKAEKDFFLNGTDPRLIPRGLMMDGPPGTGKTAAAKWIAQQFDVPLYRVDIGGTKGKYVGESEGAMLTNLSRLDYAEPAIALFDEVEKVFSSSHNDTSGTTTTMLSQLLWWLAERKSRVMVVMTTNDAKALPKELYREGRVDKVMWFGGLNESQAPAFTLSVMKTFPKLPVGTALQDALYKIVKGAFISSTIPNSSPPTVSQAALTKGVYAWVKGNSV